MSDLEPLHVSAIGVVHSDVVEQRDDGWASVVSVIDLDASQADGLNGLVEFSHALVVYYMHLATFNPDSDLRRRPRGRADMPNVGIFAQRARHRPNPIGVTAVEIVSIEGTRLTVRGLDAIDGTPVLDIKPYVPAFDKREASLPQWMDALMTDYF